MFSFALSTKIKILFDMIYKKKVNIKVYLTVL